MVIKLFKKPYNLRKFGAQTLVRGHATAPYKDVTVMLNVQNLKPEELQSIPEGERIIRRIKCYGQEAIAAANQYFQTPGDWLYFEGFWYECVSSLFYAHTLVSHYKSEFVIMKEQAPAPPKARRGKRVVRE